MQTDQNSKKNPFKKPDPKKPDPEPEPQQTDSGTRPEPKPRPEPEPKPPTTIKPPDPLTTAKQQAVNGSGSMVQVGKKEIVDTLASQVPVPQITLQLRAIDQQELRDFSAEYTSRKAVQRTYRPSGFFGLSPAVVAALPPGAFREVDANSEFWRMFEVSIHGPAASDFTALGLTSAAVQIDYGAPDGGTRAVSETFRFNTAAAAATPQKFQKPQYPGCYDYREQTTYAFDRGWTGDPAPRTVDHGATRIRDVFVQLPRDFKFVTVNAAFTAPPDWTRLSQIHLRLTCTSASRTAPESYSSTIVVHEGWTPTLVPPDATKPAPPLPWKIRFKDAAQTTPVRLTYQLTYFLRDGTRFEAAAAETTDFTLVLDPLPRR